MARPERKFDFRVKLVNLEQEQIAQICEIEALCYPNPWSSKLLENELKNDLSIKAGILIDDLLVAQSFNHLIGDELHILNLAVHPEYRRLGLAKRLLAEIILKAIDRGAKTASLEVRISNEIAKKTYLNFGFSIVGLRKNYYTDNKEDALMLSRNISEQDTTYFEAFLCA